MSIDKKKILLLGNVIGDGCKSMELVLNEYRHNYNYSKIIMPSPRIINPKLYKIFIYPIRLIFNRGYDIYHIVDHSYGHLAYFLPKNKLIITCHDMVPLLFPQRMSKRGLLMFRLYASGLKRARIILSDESTKQELIKLLKIDPKKIIVYPNNIDLTGFKKLKNKSALKRKYGLYNRYVIMAFGNEFYKNISNILRAIYYIKPICPNIVLLKIGEFGGEELKLIESLDLNKNIIKKTNVSKRELVELYNCSDILVFPSLHMAYARPPFEAMACGIPTMVSLSPALKEIKIPGATLRVDPKSFREIGNGIMSIKNNPRLRRNIIKCGNLTVNTFKKKNLKDYPQVLREAYANIEPDTNIVNN